ncbi:MAG: cysteine-rich small domain-containing protein [Brevinematia bacterium]
MKYYMGSIILGKDYFTKQLEFANIHLSFKDCKYYPCHKIPYGQAELNCFFCFCPFYPCNGKLGSGRWTPEGIYDCSDCNFIHRNDVVLRIIKLFYEGKKLGKIRKIIRREFIDNEKKR